MLLALGKGTYKWPWYRKYFKRSLKEVKGKISDSVRSFHKLQKVEVFFSDLIFVLFLAVFSALSEAVMNLRALGEIMKG